MTVDKRDKAQRDAKDLPLSEAIFAVNPFDLKEETLWWTENYPLLLLALVMTVLWFFYVETFGSPLTAYLHTLRPPCIMQVGENVHYESVE